MGLVDLITMPHLEIKSLSTGEWENIPNTIIDSLENELSLPLSQTGSVLPVANEIQPGLIVSFQSKIDTCFNLGLNVEGIAGFQSDPDRNIISSSLFFFIGKNRLRTSKHDYYELELTLIKGNIINWNHIGWQKDVYDEFESVEFFGDLSK